MTTLRFYTGFFMLTVCLLAASAQEQRGKFDVAKMHEKKWTLIMTEVNLSPAEASAVKPIFWAYEQQNWELHKQIRELFRKARAGNFTEKEYNDLNDKMINNEMKRAQYLRDYHLKLRQLLKPETLFKYYKAEKSFERQLLRKRLQNPPPPTDK